MKIQKFKKVSVLSLLFIIFLFFFQCKDRKNNNLKNPPPKNGLDLKFNKSDLKTHETPIRVFNDSIIWGNNTFKINEFEVQLKKKILEEDFSKVILSPAKNVKIEYMVHILDKLSTKGIEPIINPEK